MNLSEKHKNHHHKNNDNIDNNTNNNITCKSYKRITTPTITNKNIIIIVMRIIMIEIKILKRYEVNKLQE